MARLFSQVLSEYNGSFKQVVFAIIGNVKEQKGILKLVDDANAHKAHNPDGNFLPFYEVFHGAVKKDANSKAEKEGNRNNNSSSKDSVDKKESSNNNKPANNNRERTNSNNNTNSKKSNNNNNNSTSDPKKKGSKRQEDPPGWEQSKEHQTCRTSSVLQSNLSVLLLRRIC